MLSRIIEAAFEDHHVGVLASADHRPRGQIWLRNVQTRGQFFISSHTCLREYSPFHDLENATTVPAAFMKLYASHFISE
jgi:hypothetical protein